MNIFNKPDVPRISQVYSAGDHAKSRVTPRRYNDRPSSGDSVVLSQEAKIFAGIKQRLNETPDVRREKVEHLKRMIESGTYHVASGEIADAMIREGALS